MTAKSNITVASLKPCALRLAAEGDPRARPLPLELQHAAHVSWLDRNRELLHGLGGPLDLHIEAGEVVFRVVLRAPLPRVPVHDERPPRRRRDRPEAVLSCRDRRAAHNQVGTGFEGRGSIGTSPPDPVPGDYGP